MHLSLSLPLPTYLLCVVALSLARGECNFVCATQCMRMRRVHAITFRLKRHFVRVDLAAQSTTLPPTLPTPFAVTRAIAPKTITTAGTTSQPFNQPGQPTNPPSKHNCTIDTLNTHRTPTSLYSEGSAHDDDDDHDGDGFARGERILRVAKDVHNTIHHA